MSQTQHQGNQAIQELDLLIHNAIKKISGNKENDICRYLPSNKGGYIHHFTMRKMKQEKPQELLDMIKKFIVNMPKPQAVPPKSRAPRGTRKRLGQVALSKEELEKLRQMALSSGDKDLARKLTQRKELRQLKKELLASIKNGFADQELWSSYTEVVNQQTIAQSSS